MSERSRNTSLRFWRHNSLPVLLHRINGSIGLGIYTKVRRSLYCIFFYNLSLFWTILTFKTVFSMVFFPSTVPPCHKFPSYLLWVFKTHCYHSLYLIIYSTIIFIFREIPKQLCHTIIYLPLTDVVHYVVHLWVCQSFLFFFFFALFLAYYLLIHLLSYYNFL